MYELMKEGHHKNDWCIDFYRCPISNGFFSR
jgi:hypothetical protein